MPRNMTQQARDDGLMRGEDLGLEEARVGSMGRGPGSRKAGAAGLLGTMVRKRGPSGRTALDVRFDNGRSELFWHRDLDVESPSVSHRSLPYYDGS